MGLRRVPDLPAVFLPLSSLLSMRPGRYTTRIGLSFFIICDRETQGERSAAAQGAGDDDAAVV